MGSGPGRSWPQPVPPSRQRRLRHPRCPKPRGGHRTPSDPPPRERGETEARRGNPIPSAPGVSVGRDPFVRPVSGDLLPQWAGRSPACLETAFHRSNPTRFLWAQPSRDRDGGRTGLSCRLLVQAAGAGVSAGASISSVAAWSRPPRFRISDFPAFPPPQSENRPVISPFPLRHRPPGQMLRWGGRAGSQGVLGGTRGVRCGRCLARAQQAGQKKET